MWSDIWSVATTRLASELESDLRDTVEWARKCLVDFNSGKTPLILFFWSNNTGAIDVKMDASFFEEKSYFKMLRLIISPKLDWVSYLGALICSMKFLSPGVALYLCKSTIQSYMKYCCHIWAVAPSCYMELLDKLQKQICRVVGPLLSVFL